ncbi:glycosyltransferase, partial [Candidatus Sumerlaeota bacterium]|nr:glycosyltransferase [Candidatus Sumerlaeota bacterium]
MTIRVAHILDGRFFGGAEQMVRRLAKSSPKIGVEAAIYCLAEGRLSEMLRADHLPLRVFPSSGRLDFRPLGAMTRALRGDQIQIIQAHTSRTHLLARILSHRVGIPNITTIQSPIALDENQGTQSHPLRAWIERAGRRWTDHLCPVSREETERLIREEGVPKDKITCIPNGVEAVETKSVVQARATDAARALAGLGISMDGFLLAMIA